MSAMLFKYSTLTNLSIIRESPIPITHFLVVTTLIIIAIIYFTFRSNSIYLVDFSVKGEFTHKLQGTYKLQQAVCSATQADQLVHSQPRKDTSAHLQLEESSCAFSTNNSSSSTHNSSLKAAD
jgi:hypothetical protein